jgi:hypothetical protein
MPDEDFGPYHGCSECGYPLGRHAPGTYCQPFAVSNLIKSVGEGDLDEYLADLKAAISARLRARKEDAAHGRAQS